MAGTAGNDSRRQTTPRRYQTSVLYFKLPGMIQVYTYHTYFHLGKLLEEVLGLKQSVRSGSKNKNSSHKLLPWTTLTWRPSLAGLCLMCWVSDIWSQVVTWQERSNLTGCISLRCSNWSLKNMLFSLLCSFDKSFTYKTHPSGTPCLSSRLTLTSGLGQRLLDHLSQRNLVHFLTCHNVYSCFNTQITDYLFLRIIHSN